MLLNAIDRRIIVQHAIFTQTPLLHNASILIAAAARATGSGGKRYALLVHPHSTECWLDSHKEAEVGMEAIVVVAYKTCYSRHTLPSASCWRASCIAGQCPLQCRECQCPFQQPAGPSGVHQHDDGAE